MYPVCTITWPDGRVVTYQMVPITGAVASAAGGVAPAPAEGPRVQVLGEGRSPGAAGAAVELEETIGQGIDLIPPAHGVVGSIGLRATDPRVFAIAFEKRVGGDGFKSADAKAEVEPMLTKKRTGGKLKTPLKAVKMRQPNYGLTEQDLAGFIAVYRITTGRTPKSFDLTSLQAIEVPSKPGVWVFVGNRTDPKRAAALPSVKAMLEGA